MKDLLFNSSDWTISKFRSILKLIYFSVARPILCIGLENSECRYLICPRSSYESKRYFYNSIAMEMNCGVLTLDYSIFKANDFDLDSLEYVCFWSLRRLSSLFLMRYLKLKPECVDVFQHGFFKNTKGLDSYFQELSDLQCRNFYVFEDELLSVSRSYPCVDFRSISAPPQPIRRVISGCGFATRGPEFFMKDYIYLKRSTYSPVVIYFHPNYSVLLKICFILLFLFRGRILSIGTEDTITSSVITESSSFCKLAQMHSVTLN